MLWPAADPRSLGEKNNSIKSSGGGFIKMQFLNWINTNQSLILVISNIVLVIVTTIYVILTRRIVKLSELQIKTTPNALLGVKISRMYVSKVTNEKRALTVSIDLQNISDSTAINIQIMGELVYSHTSINGLKKIPSQIPIRTIPFILPGELVDNHFETDLFFDHKAVIHLFDDFRENNRLNQLRIDTNPTKSSINGPKLNVKTFYNNNLGQLFESEFEVFLDMWFEKVELKKDEEVTIKFKSIPQDDEQDLELDFHRNIRPVFTSKIISNSEYHKIISRRNSRLLIYEK